MIGNPVASPSTLQWVYPLNDSDSVAIDRHMMIPSADTWEEYIEVIGGTPPYNFDIQSAPTGFTVGHIGRSPIATRQATYFRWTNPQIGTHNVQIRVRDQLGASATLIYTPIVYDRTDTTKFCYMDSATGNNSNTGSPSSPKQTLAGVWGPLEDTSTHANKQVFFNGGTYLIGGTSGMEFDGFRITINDTKPKTYVGVYGTRPRWNNGSSAADGTYVNFEISSHFRMSNADWGNPSYTDTGLGRRHCQGGTFVQFGGFGNVTFIGTGTTGTANVASNNACIFLNDESTARSHAAFSYLYFSGCEYQLGMQNYNTSLLGASGWGGITATNFTMMHDKGGTINDVQMLACDCWNGFGSTTNFRVSEWINSPISRFRLSNLYCNVKTSVGWFLNGSPGDNYADCVSARCNWNVGYNDANADSGVTTSLRDFVQYTDAAADGWRDTGTGTLTKTSIQSDNTASAFDANNLLQGAFRASFLGANGAEMTSL